MKDFDHVTTEDAIAVFEAAGGVFGGVLAEMRELSKKKPDITLSRRKVQIVNRILKDLCSILSEEAEGKYLDLLDNDDLPQNSDAVLVMVQYETALNAFGSRYKGMICGDYGWITKKRIEEAHSTEFEGEL